MSKLAIALFGTCVLFSGCATYEWQHSTKDASQADSALLACEEKALKLYPTLITQETTGGRAKGANSVCAAGATGSKAGGTKAGAKCVTQGGKARGASTRSRDINRNDRNRVKDSCMRAAGWRQVEVK